MSTKAIQGKLWSVAPNYWSRYFEPFFIPMYRESLKYLSLTEKDFLLDAGCGSGLFSRLAIEAGAQVIGIDAAPGLLELARRRNPDNNFLEEDLENLPFSKNSFDVVAGFNSFQYAAEVENALQEAKRVLRPGGRLVMGIWDRPEINDATQVLKAIGTLLPPPPPGAPSPFALSEDGKVESIFEKIGLKLTRKIRIACPFYYGSHEEAIKSFLGTGPAAAAIEMNGRDRVEQTISEAISPFRIIDDLHFLQNQFLVFIAEK